MKYLDGILLKVQIVCMLVLAKNVCVLVVGYVQYSSNKSNYTSFIGSGLQNIEIFCLKQVKAALHILC